MKQPLSLALLVVLAACQSSPEREDPTVFADESVSFVPPAGWEVRRDRDTLVLVGGSPKSRGRPTIAVRAVPVDSWSEERTVENVVPSTEKVLRALPAAQVTGPFDVEHPIYQARAFDVTWTPRSRKGQRYQRRHVQLAAHNHIYHVFLTAPEGELEENRGELDRVVETLREEG